MTPKEADHIYAPLRDGVDVILNKARKDVYPPDIERAARQLGLWQRSKLTAEPGTAEFELAMDVTTMEPNPRGMRPFDRFLEKRAASLPEQERALAERMKDAWFSVFRVKEPHPAGGAIMIDLLHDDREFWMMDRAMGRQTKPGTIVGFRMFDAGPFCMGLSMGAVLDETAAMLIKSAMTRDWHLSFRVPLSALLYGRSLGTGREYEKSLRRAMQKLTASLARPSAEAAGSDS